MILKGFFRNKNTIIYLVIYTLLFTIIISLNAATSYLDQINKEYFYKRTYICVESSKNIKTNLLKDKSLKNIYNILNLTFKSTTVLHDYDQYNLVNYEINGLITYKASDKNQELNNDEVIIYLDETNYLNYRNHKLNNDTLTIAYNNEEITLNIKKLLSDNKSINEIVISDELFNKISSNNKNYLYISNIINEDEIKNIINKYSSSNKVILIENEDNNQDKIKNMLNQFTTIDKIFIIIFMIIIIVININLLADLKKNVKLENILGFNKKQIILNLIKRIFILNILSIIITLLFILIAYLFIKFKFKTIISFLSTNLIYYLIFIFICYLLLILIVSNKSNIIRRM